MPSQSRVEYMALGRGILVKSAVKVPGEEKFLKTLDLVYFYLFLFFFFPFFVFAICVNTISIVLTTEVPSPRSSNGFCPSSPICPLWPRPIRCHPGQNLSL
jgi:hypothetical protein